MRPATPTTPAELAGLVRPILDRALLAFDVDGVLAPIVEHAEDSVLSDGVHESLGALAARSTVAVLSGRSLESLQRLFRFPPGVHVVGSHGLEVRGHDAVTLTAAEAACLARLESLAQGAVGAAGAGAWLEHKPASVVLHTRSADPERGAGAAAALARAAGAIDGAQVKPGHHVLELLARRASKGDALAALAERLDRRPIVFVGDDVTDEDAFAQMSPADGDVSVKIGPAPTAARFRLPGPDAAAAFLHALAGP